MVNTSRNINDDSNQMLYKPKERNSNLEFLRIIAMLLIIAHHSVVNSGITKCYDFNNISANMIFLQLWGMWGKTAINMFVMITGYFMCKSKLTFKRFFKMWFEVKFYKVLIFFIFVIIGYEILTIKRLFKLLFAVLCGVNSGFTNSFLVFYLFIPFMNKLIEKLNKKEFEKLIVLLLLMFTISSTFFFNSDVFHYVFWYVTLYFVAAYIRIYPNRFTDSWRFSLKILMVTIILSYASVLVVDFIGSKYGFTTYYYMVSDSNKLFAFIVGVSTFLFFKNLDIKNNKIINTIASTTFGIFLIHANSSAMRQWLWKDFLKLPDIYYEPFYKLVLSYIIVLFGIFLICSLIDYLRIKLIEQSVFHLIDVNEDKIENTYKVICNRINYFIKRMLFKIKV